jgi:hypothetical protein
LLQEFRRAIQKYQSRLEKELTREIYDDNRQQMGTDDTPSKDDMDHALYEVSINIEINHGSRSEIERLLDIENTNKTVCENLKKKVSEDYSGFYENDFLDELGDGQLKSRFWDLYHKEYIDSFENEKVQHNKISNFKYAEDNNHLSIPGFYSVASSCQDRRGSVSLYGKGFDSVTHGDLPFEQSEQLPERSEGDEDMVDMDLLDEKKFKGRERWVSKSCQAKPRGVRNFRRDSLDERFLGSSDKFMFRGIETGDKCLMTEMILLKEI